MIYKVLHKEEIGQLKEELSLGLPGTAKIYYVIRNALDDNLSGFEVIVDNWPKWNCILLRPESPDKVLNYFRQTHICHTKSVSALKYFLQRPGLISWNQPINFTGVPNDVVPVLSEVCRKHGGQITSKESRLMYAWSKSTPPDMPKIPEGVTLSSLKSEHAKILQSDWAKQGNAVEVEGYFQSVIEKFESSCLLDHNGRILAYICMQYNGSIAMIYVLPEFRKEGYFDILVSDLTRKLLAKQDIAYGFIPFTDTSLINLSRELGFEWVPQGNMTWTRYTPNVHQRQRQKAASESDVSDVFSNNLDTLLKTQLGVPLVNI
ncbi:glycine N-acyltransferase-like [Saccostrea echinata]|uniref:glycine N-acyltransferase-like n=1 Tax=Saccostrea echinata TaxID=191078 RepID=UPI002A828028|nr:glycine N-acyltransferase-like [Saccostrea echinata]